MFKKALLISLLFVGPANAWTYNLKRDLGVVGFQRHCLYSNDETYAVNSTDLCPMSVEDSAPGFGGGTGYYQGEYQDGLNKVCVYDVLGEQRAIRVSSISLCPQTQRF
ncbi:hypothetical protein [Maritalea porphyrae]|uniref:hypothetical protein n=1 Tax=Maritalea porphyrae TaxID=880732 RepID=UPI0022AE861E|nr:hypothetical protein [Maritalea porphyrae]MCZ4270883.1 hypothetical protein [Maritalea porphyrae]